MAGIAATDLERGDRIKLATIITLEIQHRDLIQKFIAKTIAKHATETAEEQQALLFKSSKSNKSNHQKRPE
jgi:hypothetical protein